MELFSKSIYVCNGIVYYPFKGIDHPIYLKELFITFI